jgi:hypothetical protein
MVKKKQKSYGSTAISTTSLMILIFVCVEVPPILHYLIKFDNDSEKP